MCVYMLIVETNEEPKTVLDEEIKKVEEEIEMKPETKREKLKDDTDEADGAVEYDENGSMFFFLFVSFTYMFLFLFIFPSFFCLLC